MELFTGNVVVLTTVEQSLKAANTHKKKAPSKLSAYFIIDPFGFYRKTPCNASTFHISIPFF